MHARFRSCTRLRLRLAALARCRRRFRFGERQRVDFDGEPSLVLGLRERRRFLVLFSLLAHFGRLDRRGFGLCARNRFLRCAQIRLSALAGTRRCRLVGSSTLFGRRFRFSLSRRSSARVSRVFHR